MSTYGCQHIFVQGTSSDFFSSNFDFLFFLSFFLANLKDWFVLDIVTIYIVIESNCVVLFIVDLHVGNIAILK